MLLITAGISFVLGFIYMLFLKCCAGLCTWLFIIGYHLVWLAGAAHFYLLS